MLSTFARRVVIARWGIPAPRVDLSSRCPNVAAASSPINRFNQRASLAEPASCRHWCARSLTQSLAKNPKPPKRALPQ